MKFIGVILFLIFPFLLGEVVLVPTFYALNAFWFIASTVLFLYLYLKKDKEYKTDFKDKYFEEIPNERAPELLGILFKGEAKEGFFVASILEMIRKNIVRIAITNDKKDYILINNSKRNVVLSKGEYYLIKWLFHYLGNDYEVSLQAIVSQSKKNAGFFSHCFHEWSNIVEVDAAQQNIFENKGTILNDLIPYFGISFLLSIYNVLFVQGYVVAGIIFVLTIAFIVYTNTFQKRTRESILEYRKWVAFENYIKKEDNRLHELDSDSLSKLAVYCRVLNLQKYFEKIYKKSRKDNDNQLLVAIDMGVVRELDKAISHGIMYSEMATNLFYSKNKGHNQLFKRRYNRDYNYIYKIEGQEDIK